MSTRTFIGGLLILVLLLVALGGGIGEIELAIWVALVAGWTVLWVRKRRIA